MSGTTTTGEQGGGVAPVEEPGLGRTPVLFLRERGWLLDLLVVLGVFVYNLPLLPLYSADPVRVAALAVISVGVCGAYVFRRRYPLAVLGVILIGACAQVLLGAPLLPADLLLLFALYNVATRCRWPVSLPSAAVLVVWLLVAVLPRLGEAFVDVGQLGMLLVVIGWVWTWGALVRTRREYVTGLQEYARQLEREREARARIAVVDERARIAREMHDIVSHGLSVVVVMSEGAALRVEEDPACAKSVMLTVRDTGRSALAEMRRMLGVLRDDEPGSHVPQPGIAQLDQLVAASRAAGLPVSLVVDGEPVEVSAGLDLAVYRVVQEALTNVRKHAGPSVSQVEVRLRYGPGEVELRVVDDGRGPDEDALAVGAVGGHGLVGLRERVAAYGGTVRVGMRPSGGFVVSAVLPIGGDS